MQYGHRFADVQDYTLPQIELFTQAISEQESEQVKRQAIAARAAQASKNDFNKFMRGD